MHLSKGRHGAVGTLVPAVQDHRTRPNTDAPTSHSCANASQCRKARKRVQVCREALTFFLSSVLIEWTQFQENGSSQNETAKLGVARLQNHEKITAMLQEHGES